MEMVHQRIVPVPIEDELTKSYLEYSLAVNVARALPDARDGLKSSQRRILVAMNDLNLLPGRGYRKCAKIAGDTSGNYHPHGEAVIYPTLVRMAQDFSMRYPLVDGQGNFGSIDGDPAGAMRYTEARMDRAAVELLADLDKNTVDFVPNYDDTREEPAILPGKLPNLLCNGASGIGVGFATNIPPHNICEVVDGIVAFIDDPDVSVEALTEHIKAPDFPTGGIIYGTEGVREAYATGRGSIKVRATASVETLKSGKEQVIISEIPYMVSKASLIEKIADLVQHKKIDGIADINDESDRDGMRIVIELRRDAYPDVVLNQLYKHSDLETTFGVNMLAVVDQEPAVLTLKQVISLYVDHRHEVVTRRTEFELDQAQKRAHLLEGFRIALDHIDEIIRIIRASQNPEEARAGLMEGFGLSEIQARSICEMQLQRLTRMEREKIETEYLDLIRRIADLESILASKARRMAIIRSELLDIKERFGDERRTAIVGSAAEFSVEDLIAEEDMVITISHTGYIKRQPVGIYRRQRRGGRGVTGMTTKDEDFVEHLFIASTHSHILFLTDKGTCYWLKVHEIPQGGRASKGRPVVNLLNIGKEEAIAAIVPVKEFDDEHYIVMATRNGIIKKTALSAYGNPRRTGINAIRIVEGDRLIEAKITDGTQDIVLATRKGLGIRFHESDVRDMGRVTQGVRGVRLGAGDEVVGMVVVRREGTLLVVCENGYGKRSALSEYRIIHRGGKGVISIKTTERNGDVVTIKEVVDDDELMIISQHGVLIRLPIRDISVIGRNTQGVKLINLGEGDRVIDVARVMSKDEEEEAQEGDEGEAEGEEKEAEDEGDGGSSDSDDLSES